MCTNNAARTNLMQPLAVGNDSQLDNTQSRQVSKDRQTDRHKDRACLKL